nr:hypothetical protein [Mycobacterium colombiense]
MVDESADGAAIPVGQQVIGLTLSPMGDVGAYAEYVVTDAGSVVRAPGNATAAAASTLLMNALTAYAMLEALAVPAGGTVAVTGAAGALGGYAVQLAKSQGLQVVADAAETDEQLVKELGADIVVRRGDKVATASVARYLTASTVSSTPHCTRTRSFPRSAMAAPPPPPANMSASPTETLCGTQCP